jgi:hypothetical protein
MLAGTNNRKVQAFIHDAVCEYNVFKGKNWLKLGGGLTITNGLSRFSQPSIGTITTLDVPVFLQATVDQTDEFSRKMSVYARGQIGKWDYRFSLSDPYPIANSGNPVVLKANSATFAGYGHHKQYQSYIMYQFFEKESIEYRWRCDVSITSYLVPRQYCWREQNKYKRYTDPYCEN